MMPTTPVQFQGIWKIQETPESKAISERITEQLEPTSVFDIAVEHVKKGMRPRPFQLLAFVETMEQTSDEGLKTAYVLSEEDLVDFYNSTYPDLFSKQEYAEALVNEKAFRETGGLFTTEVDTLTEYPVRRFFARLFTPQKLREAIEIKEEHSTVRKAWRENNFVGHVFSKKRIRESDPDGYKQKLAAYVESKTTDALGNDRVDVLV